MKKPVLSTSLPVLSSLTLVTCGGDNDDKGVSDGGSDNQVYTVVKSQKIPSADPPLVTDEVSFTTLDNVYEGIYRLNKNNKPTFAGVVEEATIPEDGLVYKAKLCEESK